MANSIRTPRQGNNATSRRIAQAVDDEEWQKFRLSMKGKATVDKLAMLRSYFNTAHEGLANNELECYDCDFCIRVDNYIKALCRGGQLYPGEDLQTALEWDFKLPVRK